MASVRVSAPDESGGRRAYDVGDLVPRIMHATAALEDGAAVDELDRRLLRHAATELLMALARPVAPPSRPPARTPARDQARSGGRKRAGPVTMQ